MHPHSVFKKGGQDTPAPASSEYLSVFARLPLKSSQVSLRSCFTPGWLPGTCWAAVQVDTRPLATSYWLAVGLPGRHWLPVTGIHFTAGQEAGIVMPGWWKARKEAKVQLPSIESKEFESSCIIHDIRFCSSCHVG